MIFRKYREVHNTYIIVEFHVVVSDTWSVEHLCFIPIVHSERSVHVNPKNGILLNIQRYDAGNLLENGRIGVTELRTRNSRNDGGRNSLGIVYEFLIPARTQI